MTSYYHKKLNHEISKKGILNIYMLKEQLLLFQHVNVENSFFYYSWSY